jgi:hypothetical protein
MHQNLDKIKKPIELTYPSFKSSIIIINMGPKPNYHHRYGPILIFDNFDMTFF